MSGSSLTNLSERLAALTPQGKQGVPMGDQLSPAQSDNRKPPPVSSIVFGPDTSVSLLFCMYAPGVSICGGKVGVEGSKFCTSKCTSGGSFCGRYSTHSKKAEILYPAYYIPSGRQTAFITPFLQSPSEGFPDSIMTILSSQRIPSDWVRLFKSLSGNSLLSTDEIEEIGTRFDRPLVLGKTPMRPKKRAIVDMDDDNETEQWSLTSTDIHALTIDDSLGFEAKVQRMVENWNGMVTLHSKQRNTITDTESLFRNLLEEVDDKVVKVSAEVGTIPLESAPALTVWSSLTSIVNSTASVHDEIHGDLIKAYEHIEKLQQGQSQFDRQLEDHIIPNFTTITNNLEVLNRTGASLRGIDSTATSPFITGAIDKLKQENLDLKREVSELKASVANQPSTATIASLQRELGRLRTHVITLDTALVQERTQPTNPLAATIQAGPDVIHITSELERMEASISSLLESQVTLQEDNVRLRQEINSEAIAFGGHTFLSPESFRVFAVTHVPGHYYGFCYDLISALECYSDWNRITNDGMANLHVMQRAGFGDIAMARISTSFGTVIPKVLGEGFDKNNPSKKMALLSTYEAWDDPGTRVGIRYMVNDFLDGYRQSVGAQITGRFGTTQTAHLFFHALLQNVQTFWDRFCAWVTNFERELVHQAGVQSNPKLHKESVWSLICWMMHAMFVEMAKRRSPGTMGAAMGQTDAVLKCASILHGTLAAHKFMDELVRSDFIRHNIFSSTMNEFLMRSKATQSTVVSMRAEITLAKDLATKAAAAADSAVSKINALKAQRGGGGPNPGRGGAGRGGGENGNA